MLKIAITGNIASGKSLFENYLKLNGFKVLCLDEVTHFLYENSLSLREFLLKKFNTTVRSEVAAVVFQNEPLKKELENFIYPLILDEMNKFFVENLNEPAVFVSAALLFEAGFDKFFDKTAIITADEKIRLKRLIERNGLTEAQALARIKSQGDESAKIRRADFIIDNSGEREALKTKVQDFIKALSTLL